MRSPYGKDIDSDIVLRDNPYSYYTYVYSKVNYTFNPQNYSKFMQLGYIRTPKLPSILNISRGEYLIIIQYLFINSMENGYMGKA